jgi:hypothetical protein
MVGGTPGSPASPTTKTGHHNIAESGINHQKSSIHYFIRYLFTKDTMLKKYR